MKQQRVLVLAFVLILLAAGWPIVPVDASKSPALTGICVHSLTEREARLVTMAGAQWISADVAEIPGTYSFAEIIVNAKKNGLKILGILDIWTMKWNWAFTLDEWESSIRANVAMYNASVDAWRSGTSPGTHQTPSQPRGITTCCVQPIRS